MGLRASVPAASLKSRQPIPSTPGVVSCTFLNHVWNAWTADMELVIRDFFENYKKRP